MRRLGGSVLAVLRWSAIALLCAYAGAAVWAWMPGPSLARLAAGAAFAVGCAWAGFVHPRRWSRVTARGLVLAVLVALALVRPSGDRVWSRDQARMPMVERSSATRWRIANVRHCRYRSTTDFDVVWEDRSVDLVALDQVWLLVEPFDPGSAIGHLLLSFGFADGRGGHDHLAISVEIRREQGESFSPVAGLYKRYELMYVIGDERDLIRLRADFRHDECYLYPLKVTPEQARELFAQMVARAEALDRHPEFYHTVFSTCTTNVVAHVNEIWPGTVPLAREVVLPGNADRLAHRLGLIDSRETFERCRERYRINERSLIAGEETYSEDIRSAR